MTSATVVIDETNGAGPTGSETAINIEKCEKRH